MKKVKYLFFIFLLLQINTFSQKGYLKFMTTQQGKWLQNTYDLNEALKWENYYSFNISKPDGFSTLWYPYEQKIINGQTETVRQTGILLENDMNIEFDEAADEWCKGTDNLLHIHTNVSKENGAELYFSTDVRYFPDQKKHAARTIFCSDGQYFVVSTDKQVIYDPYLNEWNKKAKIVYNNTTDLGYVWTTATSNLDPINIPFKSISMHELGHLLGLNHEVTNSTSIMSDKFTAGTFPTITSYDWNWLLELINRPNIISTDPADNEISFNWESGTYTSPIFFNPTTKLDGVIYYTMSYTEEGRNNFPVTLTQGTEVDASTAFMRSIGQGDYYIDAAVINRQHTKIISKHYQVHYHMDIPTGIEDCISFYIGTYQNPTVIAQNGTYEFHWAFVDNSPYDDYLRDSITTKIYVQSTSGEVVLPFTEYPYPNNTYEYRIGQLPQGYCWMRDENGNIYARIEVKGIDNDGAHHVGVYQLGVSGGPSVTTSGTLPNNEYWGNHIYIYGDVTIPAGKTLTILPNTTIYFNNNSSLIVNGSLNANGATFDFVSQNSATYNGIKVYGTAAINSSTIKNAYRGLYVLSPASLTLNSSTIANCYFGLYSDRAFAGVYNSAFTGCTAGIYSANTNAANTIPVIEHNTFSSNTYGIYLSTSSPRINSNDFGKNGRGISGISSSSPSFGYEDESGNCTFYDNTYAIELKYSSNPFLGSVSCVNKGGYNTFLRSTSWHIFADNTCFVEARCNYWNDLKISGANVYYDPYFLVDATGSLLGSMAINTMSQSPEEKLYNAELSGANSLSVNMDAAKENIDAQVPTEPQFNEKWPLKTKTSFLKNLVLLKKYDNAIKIGKELIKGYPDSTLSVYALDLLWQSGRTNVDRNKDFNSFLKELTSKGEKKYLHGKAELILALCDTLNGTEALDKVLEKYKGEKLLTEEILMDKFSSLLSRPEDREKASLVLSEIDNQFPNSQASAIAHLLFDGKTDNVNGSLLGKESAEGKDITEETNSLETIKEYELLGNYPNPFNPETVIRYALPEESNVELKIYNLMGKLVRTFTYNSQSSGYRNITWNGKDESGSMVSSGIYIYRLQAVSNKNQGRVFVKSAKMMMLK